MIGRHGSSSSHYGRLVSSRQYYSGRPKLCTVRHTKIAPSMLIDERGFDSADNIEGRGFVVGRVRNTDPKNEEDFTETRNILSQIR